uniref:DNA-directed RNA polymerase subunit omega n=1 Tax=Apophlaea sinclairii TaxID=212746 RepID=A0A1C9CBI5_9FLOR|nr:hypothetical protein Apop_073 [Apophlaea sinclairii]AOM65763.1 hypothetical protein Apop_073 [Apophlaea sinclairii]
MMLAKLIHNSHIIYKIERLLDSSNNRYNITLKVSERAKMKKYEDLDIVTESELKPVIRAIIEITNENIIKELII